MACLTIFEIQDPQYTNGIIKSLSQPNEPFVRGYSNPFGIIHELMDFQVATFTIL